MKSKFYAMTDRPLAITGIGAALLLLFIISPTAEAHGKHGLSGTWDRLNPDKSNPTPEHEVLRCGGNETWHCRYDKHPEPRLGFETPPDATYGRFRGQNITSEWACPGWFPSDICDKTTFVAGGVMNFALSDGGDLIIDQELILTEDDGDQVLYVYWVDQFACPWYGNFNEALAANPFPTPFNGEDWPQPDCLVAP